jgi:peptidyl-dipeptidase Dcp
VEYPSQVNEIWAWDASIIDSFARHIDTGQPLPDALKDTMAQARRFDQGFQALERIEAMLIDQAWHQAGVEDLPSEPAQIDAFEQAALRRHGVDFPLVPPRYRSRYFSHIWGSHYAAGYYAYLWAEVMDADTSAWFEANGGLTRRNGDTFRRQVLAIGGSVDVMGAYRQFRGADPDPIHLFRRRGLLAEQRDEVSARDC